MHPNKLEIIENECLIKMNKDKKLYSPELSFELIGWIT